MTYGQLPEWCTDEMLEKVFAIATATRRDPWDLIMAMDGLTQMTPEQLQAAAVFAKRVAAVFGPYDTRHDT